MKHGFLMLGAACALCASASAATPGNWSGTAEAGYTTSNLQKIDINQFNIGGLAKYRFDDSGFNVQGSFKYSYLNVEYEHLNSYDAGGAVFYRNATGALGVFGNFKRYESTGSVDVYNYGLTGEWYAAADITARAYFAGLSADGMRGAYGGGGASYYVVPDLSLKLDGTFSNLGDSHWLDLKVGSDYLFSHDYPVVIGLSYDYTKYTGLSSNMSSVMLRISWHIGESGSLTDLDRSGPLDTTMLNYLPL